jgi:hypothetical protein
VETRDGKKYQEYAKLRFEFSSTNILSQSIFISFLIRS